MKMLYALALLALAAFSHAADLPLTPEGVDDLGSSEDWPKAKGEAKNIDDYGYGSDDYGHWNYDYDNGGYGYDESPKEAKNDDEHEHDEHEHGEYGEHEEHEEHEHEEHEHEHEREHGQSAAHEHDEHEQHKERAEHPAGGTREARRVS